MKHSSRRTRTTAELSDSVHRQLNMYALAAGAAGVGILALAQSAEARIVYTPTDQQIPPGFGTGLYLDVNNDGINDFSFVNFYSATSSNLGLWVSPVAASNEIFSAGASYAAALPAGVRIGPRGKFHKRAVAVMADGNSHSTCGGPWKRAHNRYLGLKFWVKGKIHFGWARLNVNCVYPKAIRATLTGYAYETIPSKAIIAGATKGPDGGEPTASFNTRTPEPATLGMLALGAPRLAIWRREESVIAAPKPN
ncbi:MAG TPA: hypothetical protein VN948_10895 [Terriglobales bacterium]|nr:hypothetical protein [Terriglobales bacterium]